MGCCEEDDLTYFKAKCFLAPFHTTVGSGEGGETAGVLAREGSALWMMHLNTESLCLLSVKNAACHVLKYLWWSLRYPQTSQ